MGGDRGRGEEEGVVGGYVGFWGGEVDVVGYVDCDD